jgi:hypothetical protein
MLNRKKNPNIILNNKILFKLKVRGEIEKKSKYSF